MVGAALVLGLLAGAALAAALRAHWLDLKDELDRYDEEERRRRIRAASGSRRRPPRR